MKRVKNNSKVAMLVAMFAITFTFNACGPNKAELAIMAMPSIGEVSGLKDKLIWLQGNAQSGGNYIVEIDADEAINKCGIGGLATSCEKELSYKGKSDITITFKGIGANRTVSGSYFTVGSGVTLILDDNITLKGKKEPFTLVRVNSGGTLVMNDGSAITGAINDNNSAVSHYQAYGAGVRVRAGGTFLMKGGTISGNAIHPHVFEAPEMQNAMVLVGSKGIENLAKENAISASKGGGVYISGEEGRAIGLPQTSGTFIKTGGVITGYASDPEKGNVIKDVEGNVRSGLGHAIFFDAPERKEPKAIDTTVGPEITINFSNGVFSEGRSEEAKPQEAAAEPEEAQPPQSE
jgi:hypothetical protein